MGSNTLLLGHQLRFIIIIICILPTGYCRHTRQRPIPRSPSKPQQQQQQQQQAFRNELFTADGNRIVRTASNNHSIIIVNPGQSHLIGYPGGNSGGYPGGPPPLIEDDPRSTRGGTPSAERKDRIITGSKRAATITVKEYLRKDWCKTKPFQQVIHEPGCHRRRIMNRFCYGQCNSFFIPSTSSWNEDVEREREEGEEWGMMVMTREWCSRLSPARTVRRWRASGWMWF